MALINKISFLTANQRLTGQWLNALQNSVRFDGEQRSDVLALPTDLDESVWATNQRDPLLDWEISPEFSVGNLAWGGRIIASDAVSFAPAETFVAGNNLFVYVYAGRFLTIEREPLEWLTQSVQVTPGITQYLWVDQTTLGVVATSSEPPPDGIPLARLTIDAVGNITEYIDIRPGSFTVDFSNRTRALAFSSGLVSADYILSDWERVLADTTLGSIYIDLPANPADNAEVSIVDSEGYFHLYPVFLRPAPNGDNTAGTTINGIPNDAYALTRRYGVYTLVYSSEKGGWYFVQNEEQKDFSRGTFITCGGMQQQESTVTCTAGSTPAEFLDEEDPPIYEIIDGRCWLVYPESSAIYSNPSKTEALGIKVEHMAARCIQDDFAYISGGISGFTNEEAAIRINSANLILSEWEISILPGIGTIPIGERDVLFDLLLRTSYAIRTGSWLSVTELETTVPFQVSLISRTSWFNLVRALIDPIIYTEFDNNLGWLLLP